MTICDACQSKGRDKFIQIKEQYGRDGVEEVCSNCQEALEVRLRDINTHMDTLRKELTEKAVKNWLDVMRGA